MSEDIVATPGRGSRRRSEKAGFLHFTPLFFYLLVGYIFVEVLTEVRAPLLGLSVSWVEIFYLSAAFIGMMELLKVSEPKVDNTTEALYILLVWIVYFGLFLLGAGGVDIWFISLAIFGKTEFFMLTAISGFQVAAAFMINSRTLQLQIVDA